MAEARNGARTRGKSDPIDALAIARAALREPDLPAAVHDETSRELKLLVGHREDLLGERTRMIYRLRWHLHELDPELELPARSLSRLSRLDGLAAWLVEQPPAATHPLVDQPAQPARGTRSVNAARRCLNRLTGSGWMRCRL
jgi:transposase